MSSLCVFLLDLGVLVLLSLSWLRVTSPEVQDLYLNSMLHCGPADYRLRHKVYDSSVYIVRDADLVSQFVVTSNFTRKCVIAFRSNSSDGRLCVFQRNLEFTNDNFELRLYDGFDDVDSRADPDVTVNRDHDMPGVEWCTKGSSLTMMMVPRHLRASVEDLDIDLMVYRMSSRDHRKAYLDHLPSCGSTYAMDNSNVSVTNRDFMHTPARQLHSICSLEFIYQGDSENRMFCVVVKTEDTRGRGRGGKKSKCLYNYTLTVEGPARTPTVIATGCSRPRSRNWCSTTKLVRLTLYRGSVPENVTLFQAAVQDLRAIDLGGEEPAVAPRVNYSYLLGSDGLLVRFNVNLKLRLPAHLRNAIDHVLRTQQGRKR